MDTYIYLCVFIGLIIALAWQVVGFRFVESNKRIQIVFQSMIIGFLGSMSCGIYFGFQRYGITELGIVALLYGISIYTYIQCLYLPIEASLTLFMLSLIKRRGHDGITRRDVLLKYNRSIIVQKRLSRLMAEHVIVRHGNNYEMNTLMHAYVVREYITRFWMWLYPPRII